MIEQRRAVLYMLFSAAAFAVMGAFVKAAAEVPVVEKVVVRNLITLFIAGAMAMRGGRSLLGRLRHQPLLIARSLLGVAGVTCFFYAIDHLILADAAMLTKLSPFFVAIFALCFLGEKPPRPIIVAMVVAFAGGLCIIKPRFDLSVVPALVGLGSSVFAGGAYTAVRALRTREAAETIIFHFSLVTVLVLLPFVAGDPHLPHGVEWLQLLGIGVGAAAGQFGLTLAYRHAPAAQVSIYSYTTILFAALLGLIVWDEVPDVLSLIGGALIVAGGIVAFVIGRRPVAETAGG
jgi:drug/metabolite transporter (DMT)-like permease